MTLTAISSHLIYSIAYANVRRVALAWFYMILYLLIQVTCYHFKLLHSYKVASLQPKHVAVLISKVLSSTQRMTRADFVMAVQQFECGSVTLQIKASIWNGVTLKHTLFNVDAFSRFGIEKLQNSVYLAPPCLSVCLSLCLRNNSELTKQTFVTLIACRCTQFVLLIIGKKQHWPLALIPSANGVTCLWERKIQLLALIIFCLFGFCG